MMLNACFVPLQHQIELRKLSCVPADIAQAQRLGQKLLQPTGGRENKSSQACIKHLVLLVG